MRRLLIITAVIFPLILGACTQTSQYRGTLEESYFRPGFPETTLECIFIETLYDWKALDASRLIVWAPSRKSPYLLVLDQPCSQMRFVDRIGFSDRDGRLCGFGRDAIIIPGSFPERCTIGAIHRLDEQTAKKLLDGSDFKKPKQDEQQKAKMGQMASK